MLVHFLLQQENAADDDKVDIFLVEADYALKYVDTPYALDVIGDIGLTESDIADQYGYTKDIMKTLTGDEATLKSIATEMGDFTNNEKAMAEIGRSDYFNGTISKEKAWDNFYTSVLELYPNLTR